MTIKLLVADDHHVVRSGLASLLAGSDIKIVAEAETGSDAIKMAGKHKPDVVLLDIRMGEVDGLDVLEKISREAPKAKVVILSTHDNPTYVARAAALGARDYVLKGLSRAGTTPRANNAVRSPLGTISHSWCRCAHTFALTATSPSTRGTNGLGLSSP